MFGLITHKQLSKADYNEFRKNYCGTCKTIGKFYGLKERLLLNNDIVFLSELLSAISNGEDDFKNIKVNSCFKLPKDKNSIPVFLQYTASVNLVLGYYKVVDNIEDSRYRFNTWQLLRRLQATNFKRAKRNLEAMGLSVNSIESIIKEQFKRENGKKYFKDIRDRFNYYSKMTGQITGEVFKHGAIILNKPELARQLFIIGQYYGEIVYLVDAVEDYKKDLTHKSFNLFHPDTKIIHCEIGAYDKEQAYNYIERNISGMQEHLKSLPVSQQKAKLFISRIMLSINNKLYGAASCNKKESTIKKRILIRDRYQLALKKAKSVFPERANSLLKYARYVLFTGVLVLGFILFPSVLHASQPSNDDPGKCNIGQCCCDCCCDSTSGGCSDGCCDCDCNCN